MKANLLEDDGRIRIVSGAPEHTQAIGRALGRSAEAGDVFLLVGGLGAGKTCLTQGILWGLGVDEYARSPTFVLMSQYSGRLTLYHVDLYRLDSIEEIEDLDWRSACLEKASASWSGRRRPSGFSLSRVC